MHCTNYYHYFFLITLNFTYAGAIQKPRNYLALPLQLCFRRTFLCKINPLWLCHIVRFPFFSPVFLHFSIIFFSQLKKQWGSHRQTHNHKQRSLHPKVKTGHHQRSQCIGRQSFLSLASATLFFSCTLATPNPLFCKEKRMQTAHPTDTHPLGSIDVYWCKGFTKGNLAGIVKITAF